MTGAEESASEGSQWVCPSCGEEWGSKDRKVPGGCVGCVDVLRYIEMEAPGIGMVHNEPAAVVCNNDECYERINIDPATKVVEDDEATSIESKEFDPETGELTGYTRVEIYCSPACRNQHFAQAVPDDAELPEGGVEL
ncbi:hypothetical protein [Halobaculum sp. D14]|uniref:hypothetical protein n=1 Tax=Halobaculum sp. D14 TaxID=3421642 RepID=UPI003EBADEDC